MPLKKNRSGLLSPAPVKTPAALLQAGLDDGKALDQFLDASGQFSDIWHLVQLQGKAAQAAGHVFPADLFIHG